MPNIPITMEEILLYLNIDYTKSIFNIECPSCAGSSNEKKLNINLIKNAFNCPKCGVGGGPIHLYAYIKYGITPSEYRNPDNAELKKKIYKEIMGLRNKTGYSCGLEGRDLTEFHSKIVSTDSPLASLDTRNYTYDKMLDYLSLENRHRTKLIERGFNDQQINEKKYRSFPDTPEKRVYIVNMLIKSGCVLEGVPGFYYKDGKWALKSYSSGFLIPVRTLNGMIQGFQIRHDNPSKKLPRYMWITSSEMDGCQKGCGAKTWCHFTGSPNKTLYLTEGPLKGDLISMFLNVPVIAVAGVNAVSFLPSILDGFKKIYNCECINLCFDMDMFSKPPVRRAVAKVLKIITDAGYRYNLIKWDANYKGLDDYLLAQVKQKKV